MHCRKLIYLWKCKIFIVVVLFPGLQQIAGSGDERVAAEVHVRHLGQHATVDQFSEIIILYFAVTISQQMQVFVGINGTNLLKQTMVILIGL